MSYINKASSGASDDASLDAFYVQSVQGGASRSADRGSDPDGSADRDSGAGGADGSTGGAPGDAGRGKIFRYRYE